MTPTQLASRTTAAMQHLGLSPAEAKTWASGTDHFDDELFALVLRGNAELRFARASASTQPETPLTPAQKRMRTAALQGLELTQAQAAAYCERLAQLDEDSFASWIDSASEILQRVKAKAAAARCAQATAGAGNQQVTREALGRAVSAFLRDYLDTGE